MNATLVVEVQVATTVESVPDEKEISSWLELTVASAGADTEPGSEISVRVVDEDEGLELNSRFRNSPTATNVLSFPTVGANDTELPPEMVRTLGDIVICAPVVEREAREQRKAVPDHWAHLLVHGALHLLGYDHESDQEAEEMESLEVRILAQRGIDNPYQVKS